MNAIYHRRFGPFTIRSTDERFTEFAVAISTMLAESARQRGIGIARRTPDYLAEKIRSGRAVIALHQDGSLAGFTYIETWEHGRYVANSGLIVAERFRGCGLGKELKLAAFRLSRRLFPHARIFSITTSPAVMRMNTALGFRPVPLYELTRDPEFWRGCSSCPNYDILQKNDNRMCLCTGLLFDPGEKASTASRLPASALSRLLVALQNLLKIGGN